MDNNEIYGKIKFFQKNEDIYNELEKEELFRNAIKNKGILKLKQLCSNGEILETIICLKDNDKFIIYRCTEEEDWTQNVLYISENQLLQFINS